MLPRNTGNLVLQRFGLAQRDDGLQLCFVLGFLGVQFLAANFEAIDLSGDVALSFF